MPTKILCKGRSKGILHATASQHAFSGETTNPYKTPSQISKKYCASPLWNLSSFSFWFLPVPNDYNGPCKSHLITSKCRLLNFISVTCSFLFPQNSSRKRCFFQPKMLIIFLISWRKHLVDLSEMPWWVPKNIFPLSNKNIHLATLHI